MHVDCGLVIVVLGMHDADESFSSFSFWMAAILRRLVIYIMRRKRLGCIRLVYASPTKVSSPRAIHLHEKDVILPKRYSSDKSLTSVLQHTNVLRSVSSTTLHGAVGAYPTVPPARLLCRLRLEVWSYC